MTSVCIVRDVDSLDVVGVLDSVKAFSVFAEQHKGKKFVVSRHNVDAPTLSLGGWKAPASPDSLCRGCVVHILQKIENKKIEGVFWRDAILTACLVSNPEYLGFDTAAMQEAFSLYESPQILVELVNLATREKRFDASCFNRYLRDGKYCVKEYKVNYDCLAEEYIKMQDE